MQTTLNTLLEDAKACVRSYTVAEARSKVGNNDFVFIDVREKQELESDGFITGSVHIPRGMLEFTLDSKSPYHNPVFGNDKTYIFYCKSGGRSLLAAQRAVEMGLKNVVNMEGGYLAWQKTLQS